MKKTGVTFILIFSILFLNLAIAEDSAKVDKAYQCLEGKVSGKCSSLTLEEQLFSLLALSYNSNIQGNCKSAIMLNSKDNECWPKASCKLRETAIATLALNHISADASKPEKWMLSQNKTPSELLWFLEIDTIDASSCTIKLDNSSAIANTVSIASDKKLSLSGAGSCFSLANANYWLQVSESCLGKSLKVSCDKDFNTALLYRKQNSDIWHVSSKTQSASAGGTTETSIKSLCFKQGADCNYEGSLWAALALQKNYDISAFIPYLIALAPDNLKYSPYSFLQKISPSDEFLANIRNSQNPAGFWDLSSGYGRYYDTALAIIGLREISEDSQVVLSKDWLQSVQSTEGCWPTIKDTAFILYAAWPKTPVSIIGISEDYCEDYGKYCASNTECAEVEGEVLGSYQCKADSLKICCSKQPIQETCADKGGIKCASDEQCSGNLVSSSDSSRCCVDGVCEEQEISECEQVSGLACKSACSSEEEIKSGAGFSCSGNDVCCAPEQESSSYWWIWLLIILIILAVLGIIFRKQIRIWIFKLKNKAGEGKSPIQPTRPPFFPPASRPAVQRPMPRSQPILKQVKSKIDTELDETLRKLKEMSK